MNRHRQITKLDLDLESDSPKIHQTTQSIGKEIGLKRAEQFNALKLLLLNFFWFEDQKFIIPRAKQKLAPPRYNPSGVSYSAMRTALDKLAEKKFIQQVIGKKDLKTKKGKTTTVIPDHGLMGRIKLVDEWKADEITRSSRTEVIRIRTEKTSKDAPTILIDYEDNELTNKARKDLQAYNKLLSNTDIWLLDSDMEGIQADLGRQLIKRTFVYQGISALTFGGRMTGPWCHLSKEQRKRIWMNDAPVIEHDFASSHVNVMYRVLTGKPYADGDAYDLYVDGYKIPRSFVRLLSSIMTSTASASSAALAIRREYMPKRKKDDEFAEPKKEELIKKAEYEFITSHAPVGKIINAYLKKHEPIASHFLQGKMMGLHIQYWESQLVMKIVSKLTRQQIPVLTVYDSFIVNQEHEALLLHLMDSTKTDDRVEVSVD